MIVLGRTLIPQISLDSIDSLQFHRKTMIGNTDNGPPPPHLCHAAALKRL